MIRALLDNSNGTARIRGVLMSVWIVVYACGAPRAVAQTIQPDPAMQERINVVADAIDNIKDRDTKLHAFQQLLDLVDLPGEDRVGLVRQLLYYRIHAQDERHVGAAIIIFGNAQISPMTIVDAFAPYFGTTDEKLGHELKEIHVDYSYYQSYLDGHKEQPPLGMIEHMYRHSAGKALLTLMRVHVDDVDKLKPILWAEHVVADVLWKQQHGFLGQDQTEPEAVKQLDLLSRHDAWWARVYVAEILRQHAEFRTSELVKRLEKDDHPLVQKVIKSFR